jgi:23S rRNA G2445 N2-methylase RlmL
MADEKRNIIITCLPRLGEALGAELAQNGYLPEAVDETSASASGTFSDVLRLNLVLRTASRVLWPLAFFEAANPEELYSGALGISWENYLRSDGYFSVDSFVKHPTIRDTRFANLKFKDAIADRFLKTHGRRPDSGPEKSAAVVYFRWVSGICDVYYDTSGETLSKHGYRQHPVRAPLMESLAAALVLRCGWEGEGHFLNPMCGSGTLAIEAALIREKLYPALHRRRFAFQHFKGFDPMLFRRVSAEVANSSLLPGIRKGRIIATDRDPAAVEAARANARKAGVDRFIEFGVCDFESSPVPEGAGVVMVNPEYGERMGDQQTLEPLYARIGDFFKRRCTGYRGYVFTGNAELAKKIGLHTHRKIPFYNGKIDCRLLEYELYSGSRRSPAPGGDLGS